MSKIFITGATGFVGSHLVDKLLEDKKNIIYCLVRKSSDLQWLKDKPVNLVYGSLDIQLNTELKNILSSCDYIYHIAGAVKGLAKDDYYKINVIGTKNLLDYIVQANQSNSQLKKFVFVSSLAASGPGKDESIITEDTISSPVSWYGQSKYEAEQIVKAYSKYFPITIVRPPPVYGPRDIGFLPIFKAINNNLIPVIGKGTKTNFVYISDLVKGIILAAESYKSQNEIFNIGDKTNLYSTDAFKIIASSINKKAVTIKIPIFIIYFAAIFYELKIKITKEPQIFNLQKIAELKQTNWTMDISKAENLLNYKPQVSIEEGGKLTFEWYKK